MIPELRPCPFCGNDLQAQYQAEPLDTIYPGGNTRVAGEYSYWQVVCGEWWGGCSASVLGSSQLDCVEKWNKRYNGETK